MRTMLCCLLLAGCTADLASTTLPPFVVIVALALVIGRGGRRDRA